MSGFTLIELTAVCLIAGLLCAIAGLAFLAQRQRSYDAAVVSDSRAVAVAMESSYTSNDRQYPSEWRTLNHSGGAELSDEVSICIYRTMERYVILGTHSRVPDSVHVYESYLTGGKRKLTGTESELKSALTAIVVQGLGLDKTYTLPVVFSGGSSAACAYVEISTAATHQGILADVENGGSATLLSISGQRQNLAFRPGSTNYLTASKVGSGTGTIEYFSTGGPVNQGGPPEFARLTIGPGGTTPSQGIGSFAMNSLYVPKNGETLTFSQWYRHDLPYPIKVRTNVEWCSTGAVTPTGAKWKLVAPNTWTRLSTTGQYPAAPCETHTAKGQMAMQTWNITADLTSANPQPIVPPTGMKVDVAGQLIERSDTLLPWFNGSQPPAGYPASTVYWEAVSGGNMSVFDPNLNGSVTARPNLFDYDRNGICYSWAACAKTANAYALNGKSLKMTKKASTQASGDITVPDILIRPEGMKEPLVNGKTYTFAAYVYGANFGNHQLAVAGICHWNPGTCNYRAASFTGRIPAPAEPKLVWKTVKYKHTGNNYDWGWMGVSWGLPTGNAIPTGDYWAEMYNIDVYEGPFDPTRPLAAPPRLP